MNSNDKNSKEALIIFKIFAFSSIACYLYSLLTGKYGGDYLFQDVTISFTLLTINLILNLAPYYVLWRFYLTFKKSQPGLKIKVSFNIMLIVTFFLFIYTISVTVLYGVGKMETDVYVAPSYIKLFIQIMNRISFIYVVLFFIFLSKSFIYDLIAIILILIVSFFTAGFGSLLYIFFVLAIKNYSLLNLFYKKYKLVIVLTLFLSPFIVNQIYTLRDKLRNSESKETTSLDLVFGKLAGRLSSFPNSAVIIQEPVYFLVASSSLENFYFQIQAWKALVGGDYRDQKPEYLMKGVYNDGDSGDINSAFMTSTPGNLIIAFLKSPLNCFFNILTILVFIFTIFKIASLLNTKYSIEFALILVIYPITSGVSNEYVIIITTLTFLLLFNAICNIVVFPQNGN